MNTNRKDFRIKIGRIFENKQEGYSYTNRRDIRIQTGRILIQTGDSITNKSDNQIRSEEIFEYKQ